MVTNQVLRRHGFDLGLIGAKQSDKERWRCSCRGTKQALTGFF
jgi:hypothetical protein